MFNSIHDSGKCFLWWLAQTLEFLSHTQIENGKLLNVVDRDGEAKKMSEKYAEPELFDEIGSRPIDETGVGFRSGHFSSDPWERPTHSK